MSPCHWTKLPDGTVVHVNVGKMFVQRCRWCDLTSVALCDFPNPKHKSGTCDAPMCEIHQKIVGPDRDYCPDHKKAA